MSIIYYKIVFNDVLFVFYRKLFEFLKHYFLINKLRT